MKNSHHWSSYHSKAMLMRPILFFQSAWIHDRSFSYLLEIRLNSITHNKSLSLGSKSIKTYNKSERRHIQQGLPSRRDTVLRALSLSEIEKSEIFCKIYRSLIIIFYPRKKMTSKDCQRAYFISSKSHESGFIKENEKRDDVPESAHLCWDEPTLACQG